MSISRECFCQTINCECFVSLVTELKQSEKIMKEEKLGKIGGGIKVTKALRQIKEELKAEGLKYDSGKPPMSLLPSRGLTELSKVMAYGATKYATHNWRKGIEHSRVLDAALRHLYAYADGERIDSESNISHLAHAGVNILFLLDYLATHPELDDCYKKEVK